MATTEPGKAGALRLIVDGERCQGHNRCQVLLPELIDIDDHGFAHAAGDGIVPDALAEKARLAVKNCPEFALRLERAGKTGDTP
ncbi:MAG: ferredoxin [Hyphomicrobiaceae bacterium]